MSATDNELFDKPLQIPRRKVSIRRDGTDFVVVFKSENVVAFRHREASALRKICGFLRWEIVSDTIAEANDPSSW
jgi:hypothetical protein